jgi:hypothetical protein
MRFSLYLHVYMSVSCDDDCGVRRTEDTQPLVTPAQFDEVMSEGRLCRGLDWRVCTMR